MWANANDINQMFRTMGQVYSRINRLFPEYGRGSAIPSLNVTVQSGPRTNLYDAGDYFEMTVEVPGVTPEDLNLKVQGNYLEISGSRKSDTPEGYSAHRVEREATDFTRSYTLPSEVDTEKVEAQLANGLLTLTLPKSEEAKPTQIAIH